MTKNKKTATLTLSWGKDKIEFDAFADEKLLKNFWAALSPLIAASQGIKAELEIHEPEENVIEKSELDNKMHELVKQIDKLSKEKGEHYVFKGLDNLKKRLKYKK